MNKSSIMEKNFNCSFFEPTNFLLSIPIICLGGSEGGRPDHIAELIAQENFVTCALGYFSCEQRPKYLLEIDLEYFINAIAIIKEKYKAEKVILIGNSRGGELALLLGSLFPELFFKIITLAPSSIIHGSFPYPNKTAWRLKNKMIEFSGGINENREMSELDDINLAMNNKIIPKHQNTELDPLVINDIFLKRYEKYKNKENSKIKVEKINCPLLLISGEDDKIWPSTLYCNDIIKRLKEHRSQIICDHISFKEVGHGVLATWDLPIYHPVGSFWCSLGGKPHKNKEANKMCLEKIKEFLLRY